MMKNVASWNNWGNYILFIKFFLLICPKVEEWSYVNCQPNSLLNRKLFKNPTSIVVGFRWADVLGSSSQEGER